jgi:hypothetical protein
MSVRPQSRASAWGPFAVVARALNRVNEDHGEDSPGDAFATGKKAAVVGNAVECRSIQFSH